MEQHPIPQNISSFQFRLIGDITLKQFGYVAGGIIAGYVTTKIGLIPSLLRWPLAGFFVLFGFGLAFLPIEERPLDRWLIAFIKSIYSPTQYVWRKQNSPPEILTSIPTTQPAQVAPASLPSPTATPRQPTRPQVTTPAPNAAPKQQPQPKPQPQPRPVRHTPTPVAAQPSKKPQPDTWTLGAPPVKQPDESPATSRPPVTGKKVETPRQSPQTEKKPDTQNKQVAQIKSQFMEKTTELNQKITSLQNELSQGNIAKERLLELQQVLTMLASEKDRLSKELSKLKSQAPQPPDKDAVERPTQYVASPKDTKTTVKMVSPAAAISVGLPTLTSTPNVVTGIVKTNTGALLPNVIVTVKDKEGIPVRALKTNKLGQFAASTPLSNSTYVIEIEDPQKRFTFNRIEVQLEGKVLPPLEISAVTEKEIMRQKLTKELFGSR